MRKILINTAAIIGLSFASHAYAQNGAQAGGGEKSETGFVSEDYEFSTVDANGVDMISGSVRISADLVSIGPEGSALTYSVITPSLAEVGSGDPMQFMAVGLPMHSIGSPAFKYDSYSGGVSISGIDDCNNWFQYGGSRADFCGTVQSGFTPTDGSSATLEFVNNQYVFTSHNGTKYYTSTNGVALRRTTYQEGMNKIVHPDGYTINIYRGNGIVSVLDNRGYQIRIDGLSGGTSTITAFNMAVDYCAPLATTCTFSVDWPEASVTVPTNGVKGNAIATDMTGRQTKLLPRDLTGNFNGWQMHKVKPAGANENALITYTYCGPWADTNCGGNYPAVTSCGPGTNHPPERCKQFTMVANKVRSAQKFGKTWSYDFVYSEN